MSGVVDVSHEDGADWITWEGFSRSTSCESRFFFIYYEDCCLRMKLHLKKETDRDVWKFYITKDDEDMNVTADVRVLKKDCACTAYLPNISGSHRMMAIDDVRVVIYDLKITRKVKPPIALDLTPALKDDTYSDCILVCGKETFKAHKLILATRSSVFRAMFDSDMIEGRES